jgi:AhpD family alkylhydroperoxidase
VQLREQIAVTLAGANQCDYCASAHTFLGKKAGISEIELADNLAGGSQDGKTATALRFARAVAENRGQIGDEELQRVRDAGFSEAEIVEIIAHVCMNLLTNIFNNIADTEVDFPRVNTSIRVAAA